MIPYAFRLVACLSCSSSLAKATEDQLKLLDTQRQLERATKSFADPPGAPPEIAQCFRFVDTPLNETIYKCADEGNACNHSGTGKGEAMVAGFIKRQNELPTTFPRDLDAWLKQVLCV